MKDFIKKWNNRIIENWGCVMSDEAKSFYRDMKSAINKELKKLPGVDAKIVKWKTNHYYAYWFIEAKRGDEVIYIYMNHYIDRDQRLKLCSKDMFNHVLYRTAESPEDYTGGGNHFTSFSSLLEDVGFLITLRLNHLEKIRIGA